MHLLIAIMAGTLAPCEQLPVPISSELAGIEPRDTDHPAAWCDRPLPMPIAMAEPNSELDRVLDHRTAVILAAMRSGDVADIMALYAPGAVYAASSDQLLEGHGDIAAFWAGIAASDAHDATLKVLRIERTGPNAFVEIQQYAVFDANGTRMFGGYASLLWRKLDGRWLIAADISN